MSTLMQSTIPGVNPSPDLNRKTDFNPNSTLTLLITSAWSL